MDEDDEDEDESMVEEAKVEEESYGQCIVCQDEVTTSQPGGMLVLLQPSRILRDVVPDRDWFEESLAAPDCLDRETRYHRYGLGTTGEPTSTDAYPNQHNRFGVYMSACNHVLHEMCYMTYFDATRWRHTQQVARHHPENAVRMEYLCPLCKTLSNTLIPLDKTRTVLKQATLKAGRLPTLSEKIRSVSEEGLMRVSDSARIWDHHVETGELAPWFTDCSFHDHTLDPIHRKTVLKSISRMDERTRSLLRQLSEQSSKMRGKKQAMYIPDDVIAYTISTMEIAQRGMANDKKGLSVAEQMPEINLKLITKLLGWLQLEMDAFFGPTWDRTALRVGLFARFLPDWYRASTLPSPLLLRNPLGMVIECAAIAPDLLQPIIIMSYYAELVRAMLGLSVFVKRAYSHRSAAQPRTIPPQEPEHEDAMTVFANFKGIMYSVLRNAGPFQDTEGVLSLLTEPVLAKLLYAHTLPFLRRAAIVYYASQGRYPEIDQAAIDATAGQCEYKRLLILLAIPAPKVTLSNPQSPETPIVARWLSQWALQGRVVPNLEFPGVYELYRLPKLWETMVLAYVDKKCDKCGTKPTFPAVCLYCGMLLCLGGDCCAEGEQGECNLHLRE
jgi:E3 ubiquitin-protein ligase UBR1